MSQVNSPDGEVSIRQQDLSQPPLFAGVAIPDVLTKAMAYQSADPGDPNTPPVPSLPLKTPKAGEMTALAKRLGRVHLESSSATPLRRGRLDFSETLDKENVVNSAGKPPRMSPSVKSSPLAKNSSAASTPLKDRTPPVSPVPPLEAVLFSSGVRPAGVAVAAEPSALDSLLATIKGAVVDSAETPRNRKLATAMRGLEALLHDSFTPATGDRVRGEMRAITNTLEACTGREHPEVNDRALHLIIVLLETGCAKGTDLVSRLFDNVATMAVSMNIAAATLALFLRNEPGEALRLRKVKNADAIVRNLERQASALRNRGSTRRVRVVERAIEAVKSATNPTYVPSSKSVPASPLAHSPVPSLSALSGKTSFASNVSSPQALPMPSTLENQLTVLNTPPPRSPSAFSPSQASVKAGIPFNKRLSSARKPSPRNDIRTYTQSECDAAIRAAVLETEKRHQEISKGEYETLLRNGIAEAEMNQKQALQAEFDISLKKALEQVEDRVKEELEKAHKLALEKCVLETVEKTREECRVEYDEKIGQEVGKQKEEDKMLIEKAVRDAVQKTEDKLNLRIKELESEMEAVTREAEKCAKELSAKLEKAEAAVDEERMARESIGKNVEMGFQSIVKELEAERDELKETLEKVKEDYVKMQENEADAVEQNTELRDACKGLQAWADEVKENSQKKLNKAFQNVQQYREQFLERDAAAKSHEYLAKTTKEKLEAEEAKVAELSTSIANAESLISRLEADVRTSQSSVAKVPILEKQVSSLKVELAEAKARNTAVADEVVELKAVKKQVDDMKLKLMQSNDEVERLKKQSFDYHSKAEAKDKELEEVYQACDDVISKVEKLEKEKRKLKAEYSELERERDNLLMQKGIQ